MTRSKITLWIIALIFSTHLCASVNTRVEPSTLALGESFTLTLTLNDIQTAGLPDLMPLQTDFTIEATEHRVSTHIVNGQIETLNQWSILLTPKKTGTVAIPAIKLGQQQSTPTQIEVSGTPMPTPSPSAPPSSDAIQLTSEAQEHAPYINQQVLYTVKLTHQEQLLDSNYQPPQLDDALLVPLGSDQSYQTTAQGTRVAVEEQYYALFPQKSGTQTLTGPTFQAIVYDGMPHRVNLDTKPTSFNVKPIPKTYTGHHWLPAKAVTLSEHYDKSDLNLTAGSTIVRTITLEGVATPAELLPPLSAKSHDAFGVYPEKPLLNNAIRGQDVIGTRTLKITYLLNQAGTITLPAYSLTWFNTTTGKEEVSSLPARILQVTGSTKTTTEKTRSPHLNNTPIAASKAPISTHKVRSNTHLPWIISGLFASAWLITLTFFLWRKKQPHSTLNKRAILNALREACLKNQPVHARTAVLQWAQLTWPKTRITHLEDVIKHTNHAELNQALTRLSQALYGRTAQSMPWQGEPLWKLIQTYRQVKKNAKKNHGLPPMNPLL